MGITVIDNFDQDNGHSPLIVALAKTLDFIIASLHSTV